MNPAALQALVKGDIDNFLAASMPVGIERQEAQGQKALVDSQMIPKEIHGATREQMRALGFVFGSDADELFINCQLPAGWKKNATGHSMHSDLLDDKGRIRAGIFYKAAFYDRRADMTWSRRYSIDSYSDGTAPDSLVVRAMDGEAVLRKFGEYERNSDGYKLARELEAEARGWLDTAYPDWQSPLAHWD